MAAPQLEDGFIPIAFGIAEALCKINLSAYESRVLWFLFRKTYGWGKAKDWISLSQFESRIELDRRLIYRALTELVAKGLVIKEKVKSRVTYGFQTNYVKWIRSAPKKSHHRKEKSVQEFNSVLSADGRPVVIEGDDEVSSKGMTDLENNKESQTVENNALADLSSKGMTDPSKAAFVIEGDDGLSSKGMTTVIEGDDELSSKGIPTTDTLTTDTTTTDTLTTNTRAREEGFKFTFHKESKSPEPKKKKSSKRDKFILPDWVPEDVWETYLDSRNRKRASKTPLALNKIIEKLIEFRDNYGDDPVAVLERSITRGWADVFRLDNNGGNGHGSMRQQSGPWKRSEEGYHVERF
jgi:phage replication O-like protein O